MKIIETERLYLRELTLEDTEDLAKVLMDAESMKYYPKPFSNEKVVQWIEWNIENYQTYQHGLWAVMRKVDNAFLGDCGITFQYIDGELVPEVGFHIIKDYVNQGFATEAARASKDYAFNVLNYPRLFSYTSVDNAASQRVAEKLGMTFYQKIEKAGKTQVVQVLDRE